MPFKNNRYQPDKIYEKNMKKFFSDYLQTQTGSCKRSEYEQMLFELRNIEIDFFRQYDLSNVKQDMEFEDQKSFIAEAMKDFAIPRILYVLNEFYEQRYEESKSLTTNEFTKSEKDIAKKIWKERCKERERCPRAGVIIIIDDKVLLGKYSTDNCTNYGHSKGKIEYDETIHECAAREAKEELGLPFGVVYNLIKDSSPIKKDVLYTYDGLSKIVEHYYFIVILSLEDYCFQPNKHEIDDIELWNLDALPCCKNCLENPLVEYNDEVEEHSDYYMVTCSNFTVASSLVWDILDFVDKKNGNKVASNKYDEKHRYCQRKNIRYC